MAPVILVFSGMAMVAVWWLLRQGIMSRPWLEQGLVEDVPGRDLSQFPAAKVGLGVLLAAISSLFALSVSAYLLRMQFADWRTAPKPTLLWFNTGMLILSSAALLWARAAADRDELRRVRGRLLVAGGTALLFVLGQLLAWSKLSAAGYGVAANPASSFFYLITALHAVHVLGGLFALGRNLAASWTSNDPARLRLGLALCNTYWDFLLLVWLVLFGLLLLS